LTNKERKISLLLAFSGPKLESWQWEATNTKTYRLASSEAEVRRKDFLVVHL